MPRFIVSAYASACAPIRQIAYLSVEARNERLAVIETMLRLKHDGALTISVERKKPKPKHCTCYYGPSDCLLHDPPGPDPMDIAAWEGGNRGL